MIADRKIFLMKSLFILIICLCACSGMPKTDDNLPDYISFDQLTEGYGAENAVADNCVVFTDSRLISGEDVWKTFIAKVEKKQSCCVRIAKNYSTENNLYLIDLSYEDSSFSVNTSEGLSKEYKYLNHYEIDTKNSEPDHSIIDCYILINQENVTYKEIEKSMISSIFGDALDHYTVYFNVY